MSILLNYGVRVSKIKHPTISNEHKRRRVGNQKIIVNKKQDSKPVVDNKIMSILLNKGYKI